MMKNFFEDIRLSSKSEFEMVDITDQVKDCVARSGITQGFAVIFSQHTTGSVRISEYENGLMSDLRDFFDKTAPKAGAYVHNRTNVDGRLNAHSHLQAMVLNSSEMVPIKDGALILGKWQNVFFVEVDGPRPERKVTVQVVGE